jgi:hypothetical protein
MRDLPAAAGSERTQRFVPAVGLPVVMPQSDDDEAEDPEFNRTLDRVVDFLATYLP